MPDHRRAVIRPAGTPVTRRRCLLTGAVGALAAGGLLFGAVDVPASAGDVSAAGDPFATVDVRDGCTTASAGTGGADGSVAPQQSGPAAIEATGQGTATVTICHDDLGAPSPDEMVGSLPDDPGDTASDELDDVVPDEAGGSLEGEVSGVLTAVLDDAPLGDGDGPLPGGLPDGLDDVAPGDGGGSFPGDPGDLPGGLGGLLPDSSDIAPGDLFDRLGEIITGAGVGSRPDGNAGGGAGGNGAGAPAVNTSTNGSVSGSAAVGGVDAEGADPTGLANGTEAGSGAPALVGTVLPAGTLPRTGGGLGHGVLRLVALLGLGRGLVGLAKRRRPGGLKRPEQARRRRGPERPTTPCRAPGRA